MLKFCTAQCTLSYPKSGESKLVLFNLFPFQFGFNSKSMNLYLLLSEVVVSEGVKELNFTTWLSPRGGRVVVNFLEPSCLELKCYSLSTCYLLQMRWCRDRAPKLDLLQKRALLYLRCWANYPIKLRKALHCVCFTKGIDTKTRDARNCITRFTEERPTVKMKEFSIHFKNVIGCLNFENFRI